MTGGSGFIVSESDFVVFPAPFLAETTTVVLPAVVGTPLITPLVAFTLRPLGSPVAA